MSKNVKEALEYFDNIVEIMNNTLTYSKDEIEMWNTIKQALEDKQSKLNAIEEIVSNHSVPTYEQWDKIINIIKNKQQKNIKSLYCGDLLLSRTGDNK